MAAAAAAALLDELMGRDRNLAPTEKKKEIRWDDSQVCKHFLVKFCPNELFVNTRADLGPCDKIHDESLKKEYEKSSSYQKMGYEEDFLRFCQSMLADVERRIRRGKQRLAQGTQEGGIPTPCQIRNNEEKIQMLTERLNGLLEQVEKLGCEGKVEEAQGIMRLCDQLKEEREGLRRANENSHWLQTAEIAAAQEKQMEVCDVCGAFLIVGDAQQRVDDHLMGKQHMGYAKIKATVEEILNKRQKEREDREKKREKEREDRRKLREEEERQREKEREERRKKMEEERRRERERERERDRKRRRSRSRSRGRRRSRSRSRSRRHSRSRSRDHRRSSSHSRRSDSRERNHKERKRSHSRSRSVDRKRSRRSRSKSHRRSRSKEKHRSREHSKERSKEKKIKEKKHKPVDIDMRIDNNKENFKTETEEPYEDIKDDISQDDEISDSENKSSDGGKWQTSGWSIVTEQQGTSQITDQTEGDLEQ